jgi:hypothetical protein
LLGAFSAFFAEVVSGSSPFVFFTPFGLVGTYPIYLLHSLVLLALLVKPGRRVSFGALYAAGMVFGLYEAYITKVLWSPPWEPTALRVAGVALRDTSMLVFFWHAFMSFIIPALVAEALLGTRRLEDSLSQRWQKWLSGRWRWAALAALCGLWHGSISGDVSVTLASSLASALLLLVLVALWRHRPERLTLDLADLLPHRTEWWVLLVVLLGYYLAFGLTVRVDAIPALAGQITIWILYALAAGLWLRSQKREGLPQVEIPMRPAGQQLTVRDWFTFSLVFLLVSLAVTLLPTPLRTVVFAVAYFLGIAAGVGIFMGVVWRALRPDRKNVT